MTYLDYKREFIQKHSKADWTTETSPMDADGKYVKYYNFSDGAQLIEVNRPVWEHVRVFTEVRGVDVVLEDDVKLMETEAWNTDDSRSVKFYERW